MRAELTSLDLVLNSRLHVREGEEYLGEFPGNVDDVITGTPGVRGDVILLSTAIVEESEARGSGGMCED